MIGAGAAKTLMAGAAGVIAAARGAVAHAGWYLRYQVNGTTREGEGPPPREGSKAR